MRTSLLALALLPVATTLHSQTPLTVGRAVRATLARGDTARYQVDADSGSIIRLTVDQLSTNVLVRVLGPDRRPVGGVNAAPRGVERLQLETRAKGAHQVQVVMVDSVPGEYAITLVAREALSTDPVKLVDQLLAPWDRRDGPGAAVAVWRGGRTLLAKGVGMANLAYDIPFTATTPTNIGSTSKQFTAFAVMLLVDDGKVSLDDDVRKYFPELPDLGQRVTVRNLLTHTSGYREVYNALILAARRLDEGDFVSREEMIGLIQRQPSLQNAPGAEFNYNNTAFALLSMLVERVAGRPFPEFMAQRVFGPLGMTRTVVRADRHATVRGATVGYSRSATGEWRDLGDLASSMGAGGIYTTVGDLQKWVENYARPRVGSAQAIAQMMTPFTLTNGKSTGYGFGLFIDTQGPLKRVHHGGADVSHRSMLAYYPAIDAGVTVQSNDGGFDSGLAFRIAKAFFPELTPPVTAAAAAAFDVASYDVKRFDQFVGRYALDAAPQFVLTFTRSADSLMAQATGQSAFRIHPTSDSTFAIRVVQASVTFHRDAQGKVTGMTLHQNGDQKATRLDGEAEKPWAPTVAELAAYAGRYFSEELETFYEISVKDGKLMVANRRTDAGPIVPDAKDAFTGTGGAADVTLVFERDRNGQVIAFYAGNGRARDIRFARAR
ncbi:MAG: serine hydrolase [Gemmatimonadetes bacterium]|nr:serine hydrolase [Gemmatimonadota bacterium]